MPPTPASTGSMSTSAISSDAVGSRLAALPSPRRVGLVLALAGVAGAAVPASAQVRLSQDEALRLAFGPPATVERRTAFLSEADLATARTRAGRDVELTQRVVTYYVGRSGDAPLGVAYFDVHRVRSHNEVLMVVVSPDGRIGRIEILRFDEPPEYRAPNGWLDLLEERGLTDELSLKGAVVNMTGATLTSQAVVRAARRVLALHEVIRPFGQPTRATP